MVLLDLELRVRRNTTHRMKLFVQMLTTAGYGSLGAAVTGPFLDSRPFGMTNFATLAVGLVALALALYYVPEGEHDVSP